MACSTALRKNWGQLPPRSSNNLMAGSPTFLKFIAHSEVSLSDFGPAPGPASLIYSSGRRGGLKIIARKTQQKPLQHFTSS